MVSARLETKAPRGPTRCGRPGLLHSVDLTRFEEFSLPTSDVGEPFQVRAERRDGAVFLELRGELDVSVRDEALDALAEAVSDVPRMIVLDVRGLTFLDSVGIQCLVRGNLIAGASGSRMVILNGSGPAHRVLQLTGMDAVIEMVDDPAELDPPVVSKP